ncbi:hypothetical protein EJ06DRAFT_546668 [Trichodelitschia bisporula]|uniref:Auxin efflux carrier n=1 Tax=Trichodelitschia bisporula TaxID=703511 RepID=A0A6G1I5T1_9PEZI|nr:hypothetical protein EJ06DRAFT_546668 [Trichodelitschia bisporula]
MSPTGLINTFAAAIQASLSVLLVISYGAAMAHFSLMTPAAAKTMSKASIKIFLPALLFVKIGSELHAGSAHRYGIILLWALVAHIVSFAIGAAAHLAFGLPDWATAAIMFNNTTSYPLLLIQSLAETGVLEALVAPDEPLRAAIERAKSYFLVFATVSSCLTFAVGPRLIDAEHEPELGGDDDKPDDNAPDYNGDDGESAPLLAPVSPRALSPDTRRRSVAFFPSTHPSGMALEYNRRPSVVPRSRWSQLSPRVRWWLVFLGDFLNAPLLGAVVGAIVGLAPGLHRAFFADTQDGGVFTAWLTASLQNVGSIFVPLPVVIAGVSLYTSEAQARARGTAGGGGTGSGGLWTSIFILVVRFVVWPVGSIAVIYALAKRGVLGDDPMLWFALMLMPTGPPAMKIITMVEVSDASDVERRAISKLLAVSYVISPILAFTVVGSLRASQAAITS